MDCIGTKVLKTCAIALYLPIHHLFSLCTSQHKLPEEWKIHRITPIFKSGDKSNIKNYRSISLLCCISKVLERIIYDKIIDFILASISEAQFGFLPNRSCVQQLLLFVSSIHNSLESRTQTDVIYLDFNFFCRVPHGELRFNSIGITGNLWKWFE